MQPFAVEQYRDASPRLKQLGAVRKKDRDEHGMQIYQSSYGWIGAIESGGVTVLKFYGKCPCSG